MSIGEKILLIKKELKFIAKDSKSKLDDGGKYSYSYVSSPNVLINIREKTNEYGLILYKQIDEMIFHQKRDNKEQHVLELKMTFIWEDIESKETKSIRWYGLGVDAQEKCFGKALTYSLKYFYFFDYRIQT